MSTVAKKRLPVTRSGKASKKREGASHVVVMAPPESPGPRCDDFGIEIWKYASTQPERVREYQLADAGQCYEVHSGRGLKPETVLSRRAARTHISRADYLEDLVLYEGEAIVGLVLNAGRDERYFGGEPLAVRIVVDEDGVKMFHVKSDLPWTRSPGGEG